MRDVRCEVDEAVAAPGGAADLDRLPRDRRNPHRRSSDGRNLEQRALAEETDPGAVGREERCHRALAVRHQARFGLVDRAQQETRLPLRVDDHRDLEAAVVRERDLRNVVGREHEPLGDRQGPARAGAERRRLRPAQQPAGAETEDERDRRGDGEQGTDAAWPDAARCRCRRGISLLAPPSDDIVEYEPRVGDVVQSILRIALETAAQQSANRRRRLRGQCLPVDLGLEDAGQSVGDGRTGEERTPGQHLVEHDAERPDVRALVDRAAARLLGRHVGRGAEDDAELRAVHRRQRRRVHDRRRAREVGRPTSRAAGVHRLGQPEVEDLDLSFTGSFYVLGLEVAVDDPLLVRLFERLRDLQREGKALSQGKRPGFEALGERRAFDELHDEGPDAAALLEAEDRGDVRVMKLREELRLALEAGEALLVLGEGRGQHLDRDLALQLACRWRDRPRPCRPRRAWR